MDIQNNNPMTFNFIDPDNDGNFVCESCGRVSHAIIIDGKKMASKRTEGRGHALDGRWSPFCVECTVKFRQIIDAYNSAKVKKETGYYF